MPSVLPSPLAQTQKRSARGQRLPSCQREVAFAPNALTPSPSQTEW